MQTVLEYVAEESKTNLLTEVNGELAVLRCALVSMFMLLIGYKTSDLGQTITNLGQAITVAVWLKFLFRYFH